MTKKKIESLETINACFRKKSHVIRLKMIEPFGMSAGVIMECADCNSAWEGSLADVYQITLPISIRQRTSDE